MRMASTRAAVITVIITQPGTSPRSGSSPRTRSVSATSAAHSPRVMWKVLPVLSAGSLAQRDDADESREEREEHRHRQDQEDARDHHRDLLAAARLEQPPLAGLAHVGRLRAQDLGQRRA